MKKYFLPILLIGFWSCEEEVEEDTTPPTVTITFPQNNTTVSEIVSITCISSDNEGVEKVELWVNGATSGSIDDSEPYSINWNTSLLENGNYTITIRSYDTSNNIADSEPIILIVDNAINEEELEHHIVNLLNLEINLKLQLIMIFIKKKNLILGVHIHKGS